MKKNNINLYRTTFGIIDPMTGKIYSDIKRAYIRHGILTLAEVRASITEGLVVTHEGRTFNIICDRQLIDYLKIHSRAEVILSMQERTTGNVAIARLPQPNTRKVRMLHTTENRSYNART